MSSLNALHITNEPTATTLAYRADKKEAENILVFDFGGATLDALLLTINKSVFEVVATNGDTHLGGHGFNQCVM